MDKEVRWTNEAITTFTNVVEYFEAKWTDKKIKKFVSSTDKCVKFISQFPKLFRKTNITNVHEALVTPHNLLIYKIFNTY